MDSNVIVALDFADQNKALALVDRIEPKSCHLKVGKEMFTHFGPQWVSRLQNMGHSVFLDLKFHDIPNTTAKAVQAAADLGVWMVNVHTTGGVRMMEACRDILEPYGKDRPLLIGVTVLTSMTEMELQQIYPQAKLQQHVLNLSTLAYQSGLDGVVCSAQEANLIKSTASMQFKTVTPGIRLDNAVLDDQRRVMTPQAAVQNGADYLVIGRPITQAADPMAVLAQIQSSLR